MPRPKDYQLVDEDFATEAQEKAAQVVLDHYGTGPGETRDISELAERSAEYDGAPEGGWSRTHIDNVIKRYFEPVGESGAKMIVDSDKALRKAYSEGYDNGFSKGFEKGMRTARENLNG